MIASHAAWPNIAAKHELALTFVGDHLGSAAKVMFVGAMIVSVGALIYLFTPAGVERDIRAALAASMAEEESRRARESGRNKMLICRDPEGTPFRAR